MCRWFRLRCYHPWLPFLLGATVVGSNPAVRLFLKKCFRKFYFYREKCLCAFPFSGLSCAQQHQNPLSIFWLSETFQRALLSFRAVNVDDLTFEKDINQSLSFLQRKKRTLEIASGYVYVCVNLLSPGRPRFCFSAFELVRIYVRPVLQNTNLPGNSHENGAFCV